MSTPLTTELVPIQGALAQVAFRRSTRARKISLRIDPTQGGVVITLPLRASRRAGLTLLQTHEAWVAERLAAYGRGRERRERSGPATLATPPPTAAVRTSMGNVKCATPRPA